MDTQIMKSKNSNLDKDSKKHLASKQTYLAMGNLLNAAAEKIDVTPMEGFVPDS
jgi:hypothetical protein